jgi:hypothetical protein
MPLAKLAVDPIAAEAIEPQRLRDVAIGELLIDSHLAILNAAAKATDSNDNNPRLAIHLARAEALRKLTLTAKATPPDAFELSLTNARLQAMHAAEDWDGAIALNKRMMERVTDARACVRQLADARFGAFARNLKLAASDHQRASAAKRAAVALRADAKAYPGEMVLFEVLGIIYRQLAIGRANTGDLAEALADIQRAADCNPWQDGLEETQKQLHEAMTNLQTKMREIERQLGSANLTPEGEALRGQSRQGTGPLERYLQSSERATVRESRRVAGAVSIWRRLRVGPVPADLTRAVAMLDVIEATATEARGREPTLEDARKVAAERPVPEGLSLETIVQFVAHPEKFGTERTAAFPAGNPDCAPVSERQLPNRPSSSGVPWGFWMRSSQSRAWRSAAALGFLAMAGSAGAFAYDWQQRDAKAVLFADVENAWARQDEAATMTAIERFRSVQTLALRDARNARVNAIEARISELPGMRRRAEAWGALQAAVAAGRHQAVLDAAEAYLSVPLSRDPDPSRERVRQLYAQSLVRWLTVPESAVTGEEVQRRLEAYRRLTKTSSTRS